MTEIRNCIMLGAGRVASHLGVSLHKAGCRFIQVYSRTAGSATVLAGKLETGYVTRLDQVRKDADLYIIAVKDDALPLIAGRLRLGDKLVVHTSGSMPMNLLDPVSANTGVLYPLQTFSKDRELDFRTIPCCLEANHPETLTLLKSLALKISGQVYEVNSEQRKILHVAAVFACNFPNFMYTVAGILVKKAGLEFDLLKPLILETAQKVQAMDPMDAQTGPAIRGDEKIIRQHVDLLQDYPEFRVLYKVISSCIEKYKEPQNDQAI